MATVLTIRKLFIGGLMRDWGDGYFMSNFADDAEFCECSLALNLDGCTSCGHDKACLEPYCTNKDHLRQFAKSCDCADHTDFEECPDCFHDAFCSASDCHNGDHKVFNKTGNPRFCDCHADSNQDDCDSCGHTVVCLEDDSHFDLKNYEDRHVKFILYFRFHEDCDCHAFQGKIPCDNCHHDLNCPENRNFCRAHHKVVRQDPKKEGKPSEHEEIQQSEQLPGDAAPRDLERAGTFWTRDEDMTLVEKYLGGISDEEICGSMGRSVGAIRARLVKICFEANGLAINRDFTPRDEPKMEWVGSEDTLLEELSEKHASLALISQALQRSELAVAYRLVMKRMAMPGSLDSLVYRKPKDPNATGVSTYWTKAKYMELRQNFRAGDSIEDLAIKSGRSVWNCFSALYSRGEISDTELNLALKAALQGLDS